jgi:adenosylmethionine-8-amino-7-oxononanoate aminotransferase
MTGARSNRTTLAAALRPRCSGNTHPPVPCRYIDGIAGLFTSQLGHGRQELADAYDRQAMTLGYFPIWSYAHPRAIELAERLVY